jgi:cyclohexa-1,5-dienecarbonyl-CoA hydratase
MTMGGTPLHVELEKDGALLRLRLSRPKANIVDAAMIAALRTALRDHLPGARLRAVLLEAEGPNFSFGASVEEHLPETCAEMLRELHALILQLVASTAPVLAAVRGQCLGGGLELAAAGHLIFAAPGAMFGQPEIRLGVFAPAASCLLPERIGPSHAADLLFSGRSIGAEEAHRIGLVDALADDPSVAALAYFEEHLAPRSASSLRIAVHAARFDFVARVRRKLAEVERLYLKELMATHDAVEGLTAFIAKRPPVWEDS